MNDLVSIIIPTRNSGELLGNCLKSVKHQTYKNIEVIVVDGKSKDNTINLAKKYKCKIFFFVPKVKKGVFDASYKRNYGVKKSKGEYIYWLDADMELPKTLIEEAVNLCKKGADAVILPEESFGTGIWARAKNLERRCYWGDDTVECPRFLKHSIWNIIGGIDEFLGAGGDDLDIHQKVIEKGYKVERTKSIVMHNEGNLKLNKLIKKHFMYGRDTIKYFYKRPKASVVSYFPIRKAYLKNIKLFINRPIDACAFVIMRTTEYLAGFFGLLYSFTDQIKIIIEQQQKLKKKSEMEIEEYANNLPLYYGVTIPKLLKKYLDKTSFNSLLDCGCGDGSLLFTLKYNNYFKNRKISAIDLSKNRIELVKKINPQINAFVDNAETLSKIKEKSIDFFISTHVIEHVDDKEMINAIDRVVKKNGIIYLATVFKKWYGWYYYRKNGKWVMDLTHLREYTKDEELLDLIDKRKYEILEQQKTRLYFPIIDFFIRRLFIKNRELFVNNKFLNFLRNIKIPVIGYYNWEIILKKY